MRVHVFETALNGVFVAAQIGAGNEILIDAEIGKNLPSRTIFSGAILSMRLPSNQTLPLVARFKPEMVRSVVLLPAPLAPIRVTICPSSIWIDISVTAWTLR
jgi:hypothetical protein